MLKRHGICSKEFDSPACCIIKHTNPCGAAIGSVIREAYVKAYDADPVSAFGSIIAMNQKVDAETANELVNVHKLFVEAIIAPAYDPGGFVHFVDKEEFEVLQVELLAPGQGWAQFEMRRVIRRDFASGCSTVLFSGPNHGS